MIVVNPAGGRWAVPLVLLGGLGAGCRADPEAGTVRRCNGHAELCARRLDEVVLPATHNAMSSDADNFVPPNQPFGLQRQLEDGVRGMLLDSYAWEGDLYLCHGYCELGATPLVEGLTTIRAFLDGHPDEVLSLLFEDYITPDQAAEAFAEAGLDRYVYTPDGSEFPTLAEMIVRDTRVVVSAESEGPPPEWYQHAWDLYVDTPYSFAEVSDFNCDVNRGSLDNPLFLLNHWIADPLPSESQAAEANTYDVLMGRAESCELAFGKLPNLVAVDWYTAGDLFEVVDALNLR